MMVRKKRWMKLKKKKDLKKERKSYLKIIYIELEHMQKKALKKQLYKKMNEFASLQDKIDLLKTMFFAIGSSYKCFEYMRVA